MAQERYITYGLEATGFASPQIPIEPGSGMQIQNAHILDEISSGAMLTPDLVVNRGKRVTCPIASLAPALALDWTLYGAGETITGIRMLWNQLLQNGNLSSVWYKKLSAQGILVPTSLTASKEQRAVLNLDIMPLWSGGTLFTESTVGAEVFPVIDEAYYVDKIIVGGADEIEIIDVSINWAFTIINNEQKEPEQLMYTEKRLTGTSTIKDLSTFSLVELQQGSVQTVSVVLVDDQGNGPIITIALGDCFTTATIQGDQGTLKFDQVNAS